MKAMKITKIFLLFALVVFAASCVQDDDYETPKVIIEEPNLPENATIVQIGAVIDKAQQQDNGQFAYEDTQEYMEGYVISTDEAGNFFREIIVQDKAEAPTAGIKIMIFVNPLYTSYEVGRKIYIGLDGLTVGTSNGVFSLGLPDGQYIDEAPAQFQDNIIRTAEVAEIIPVPLSIDEFSDEYENIMVQLDNMQFAKSDVDNGVTYAGESFDEFDGERTIKSCETGLTTTFSTSTFADFASLPLASGSGTINGVLSRNFEDDKYVISVNSLNDIEMQGERCDPEEVEPLVCDGASGGNNIIFEEDFEYSNISQLEAAGWENTNVVNASGTSFIIGSFNNDKYAQISGFNSGEGSIETYLISPSVNLDSSTEEQLKFDLEVAYANGEILSVLITDDYTGDPTTTDWEFLDVEIPNAPSSGFGGFDTYEANISCLDGDVRVAFFYQGSDPSATTRYHIDNFEINGN